MQGDPVFMRRLNGWLTLFWVAMIPISYQLGWLKSVVYVSSPRSEPIAAGTFRVDRRVRLLRELPGLGVDSVGVVRGVSASASGVSYVVRFAQLTRVIAEEDLVSSPALLALSRSPGEA
jgi:hypothetical protein